jgi:hypothetical protein
VPKVRRLTPAATLALAALLTLGAAGCGNDDGSTGPLVGVGTYALVSVNGAALPFTVPNTGDNTVVVQGATLTLTDLGTYSVSAQGTRNGQTTPVLTDQGTYTQSGSQVTFRSSQFEAVAYTGTASGNTLTITLPAALLDASSGSLAFQFQK